MPFLRRLSLAILSILLLTLITSGLAQPVHAQTTSVQATVIWVNGSSPRPDVALQLYRQTTAMLTAEPVPNGQRPLLGSVTQVNWTNLDQTDINNLPYRFTVKELHYDTSQAMFVDGPPTNYTVLVTYTEDSQSAFVTNTFTSTLVDITASKNWVGGTAPRPSIAFRLYRSTGTTARQPLANAFIKDLALGTLTVIWTGLEANDTNANPYVYTVVEGTWDVGHNVFTEGPPVDYNAVYSANGLTVTNTFVEPKVTAHKDWVNGPAARPTIWFKLYRQVATGAVEPVPIAEAEVIELKSGTTEVSWTGINLNDPANRPYTFSVREVNVQGQGFTPANYDKTEAGLTVTNSYVIPKNATAKATKVWNYGAAVKPTIGFRLYRTISGGHPQIAADAAIIDLPNGTREANWTGLESTDLAGNVYTFSVKEGTWNSGHTQFTEGPPTNYQAVYSADGLTVTNTYVPPKIDVIGRKIWSGGPTAKPNIQIQLYRNGALMGNPYTLTSGVTSYTWFGVDQTDLNAATYQYTINEVTVPAYYSKSLNGMIITNTYTGTLPYTGDNTHNARWLALLLGLSALLPLISWLDLKLLTRRRG